MADSNLLGKTVVNRPRHTPARVLGLFLISFAAVSLMTAIHHRQRSTLETTDAPTAVGDRSFYSPAASTAQGRAVASIGDQPLFLQTPEPVLRKDAQMRKVAWWRRFHIYKDAASNDPLHYVKIGRGRYLALGEKPSVGEDSAR